MCVYFTPKLSILSENCNNRNKKCSLDLDFRNHFLLEILLLTSLSILLNIIIFINIDNKFNNMYYYYSHFYFYYYYHYHFYYYQNCH